MKIKRKDLKRLIEAFIVDQYGNTKHIGKKGGKHDKHLFADEVMVKSDPYAFQEPEFAKKTYDMYDMNDLESKRQALDIAAAMGAISGRDAEQAQFDINIASDSAFDVIKRASEEVDRTLLKSFVDDLHRKGELFDPNPGAPLTDIYDISDKFVKRYPDETYPDIEDYEAIGGLNIYDGSFVITDYDPNEPPPSL